MEESQDKIREKRKRWLKRQSIIEKVKNFFIGIVAVIFMIGMAFTLISGCFGTFFKSSDESQDDYEEFFHSRTP